jgi:hypothetical protein
MIALTRDIQLALRDKGQGAEGGTKLNYLRLFLYLQYFPCNKK